MGTVAKRTEFYTLYSYFDSMLPEQCQNCGSCEDLEIHHIVPLVKDGNNIIGNVVRLCGLCHGKIHGLKIERKELMREGKKRAKQENPEWREGRPRRKLTPRHLEAVRLLENHSYKETAARTGISTATLQRIKKQYKEEQAQAEGEQS